MPEYTFENKRTGKQKNLVLSLSEHEAWIEANKGWFQVIVTTPGTGFIPDAGGLKPSNHFRDFLKEVKKQNPRSTIETF